MINIFFLLYLLVLLVFLGGVVVIIYHLIYFRFNSKAIFMIIVFMAGATFFLVLSLVAASLVDWEKWNLIF